MSVGTSKEVGEKFEIGQAGEAKAGRRDSGPPQTPACEMRSGDLLFLLLNFSCLHSMLILDRSRPLHIRACMMYGASWLR